MRITNNSGILWVSALLVLVIFPAVALAEGPIVYENTIQVYQSWSNTPFWGRGPNETASNGAGVRYRPVVDQEICTAKFGLYRYQNPADSLVLTIQEGPWQYISKAGFGGTVTGPIVATSIIGQTQIANGGFPTSTPFYTTFPLSPCVQLTAGTDYYFLITRTQPTWQNGYISQFFSDSTGQTGYVSNDPFTGWGGWFENASREPAFNLEGPEPAQKKNPVLIIPGIAGSELKVGDDLIWADLAEMFTDVNDQFITENLGLDENGVSAVPNTEVGSVIKRIFNVPFLDVNIFLDLQERLEMAGYLVDQEIFFFPYDWRLDLTDTASLLADKISAIKSQTGAVKVDVVAHSMGGLLTKEYVRQFGQDSINKLVFVGTPHLGAPKAGKIILEGDRLDIPWLEADRIEEIGEHSIAVHELLPGFAYFDRIGRYFRRSIPNTSGNLLDYTETKQFLIDNGSAPNVFAEAENFFVQGLEDMPLSGIEVYNIAGCDTATQGGYDIREDGTIAFTKYRSGDKTVPLVSADGVNVPDEHRFYTIGGTHAGLPSILGVRNLIADILTDQTIGTYDSLSTDISTCGIQGQELIWRSPVEVHIYDDHGNHTGPIADNGIEYNVPGVDYEIFGHEKFIFIPSGNGDIYHVVAHGLDEGTFDLSVRQNDDGTVTEATIFNDVAVTTETEALLVLDGAVPPEILVDIDGDGGFLPVLPIAVLEGPQADDMTPPAIQILSPVLQSYMRSEVLPIEIMASDSDSGMLLTVKYLDGGILSSTSIDLFFYGLGTHSLEVSAIDRAGNTALASMSFYVGASPDSVVADIERAFTLGWIEKSGIKNALISKIKTAIRIEKRLEWLEEKLPGKPKVLKQVERLEKRLDKVLGTVLLSQLEKEYNKGNINQQAYDILKADIAWLLGGLEL